MTMLTYLNLLDFASLFELLVLLSYSDLRSMLAAKPWLYRITNTNLFSESWKKRHIILQINKKANGYRFEIEVDSTNNLRHGTYRVYIDDFCYSETEYIQGNPMTSSERHPNGFVMSETTYSSIGEVSYGSRTVWREDGRLLCIAPLKHGGYHGPVFHYEQDGQIKLQEYSHGIGGKTQVIWHDNGQIAFMKTRSVSKDIHNFIRFHRNGVKAMQSTQGPSGYAAHYQRWDEAGILIEDRHYNN